MRSKSASTWSSYGSIRIGCSPAAAAPPMSIVTESPTYTIRSGAMPGKHGRACSKMRGSGLATPTTWLSTMHSTGVRGSGTDLADAAAAELHLDLPGRVRHDPHGYAGGRQLDEGRPSTRGSATATGARGGCGRARRPRARGRRHGLRPTRRTRGRTRASRPRRRWRGICSPSRSSGRGGATSIDGSPPNGASNGPSTVGSGQDEHAAHVEEDGVETRPHVVASFSISRRFADRPDRCCRSRTGRGTSTDRSAPLATTSSMSRLSTRQCRLILGPSPSP